MGPPSPSLDQRQAGVLLHPSSLPGPHGIGDVGPAARAFVDWLAEAGVRLWQLLPLSPPGDRFGVNPYVSWSALAGNPQLLSLDDLLAEGLLQRDELAGPPAAEGWLDHRGPVRAFKAERVRRAARRLLEGPGHRLQGPLSAFRASAPWAEETALFAALAARHGTRAWHRWPPGLARADPEAVAAARAELEGEVALGVAEQFLFEQQWRDLRGYAAARGVRLLGDVPIYVKAPSVDVWRHQEQFRLLPDGTMSHVAGCPPDVFAAGGQKWGNPLYRWAEMERDGYAWWRARLARALEHADFVRIDHFRAFAAYWEIPADQPATAGRWVPGPGKRFFDALGPLPLCAEDLGDIDQPVLDLRDAVGMPGMCILQFAFGGGADNPHLPHNHVPRRIVYPGNHDQDTVLGWWRGLAPQARTHVQHYLGRHGDDIVWDLIRVALASVASVAVVQAQDLLALGSEARMNDPASYARPSETWTNWCWRLTPGALGSWHAGRLRQLIELYGRR